MYKNVVGWCPICNQGWIRIVVDDDSNQLFCCCTECVQIPLKQHADSDRTACCSASSGTE